MVAYAVQRRTKEIGIRKILGANIGGIIGLLAKDFLKPVFIALFLAAPLSWYFMNQWLENFAYRIEIQWWIMVVAGILAIGIALLTISVQSLKVALANPINSLRNE